MTVNILANGLADAKRFFDEFPEIADQAAALAINSVADSAVPAFRRKMGSQINFPSGYLTKGDRLGVTRRARPGLLEARITGRDWPTSLARFARGATPENSRKRPIFVQVKGGGQVRKLNRAFIIRLRNNNLGLAIRLPAGQVPRDAYKPVPLTRNGGEPTGVWLLYGPSVDQVLRGVADEASPEVLRDLTNEFNRQFTRLSFRRG